jgi:cytochrome d ubiquinol oxidase subunit II
VIAATVGAILLAAIALYAVLGGADFGGGLWDLLAGGDRRGARARALIDESITPVWEANHVWLIFALVIFWTALPLAFAAVMNAAALPLWLAVLGIVLRGAGFAFRKEVRRLSLQRALGAVFALSSLITPFFMGTVVGGIAAGQIPANATGASVQAWTGPTSLLTGFLFVGACAYLAAAYLVGEAAARGDRAMQAYFTRRAEAAGLVTGALSLATLFELDSADPFLFDRLTGRALPFVVIAGVIGLLAVAMLASGRIRGLRALTALGVAAVIFGWGVAQYPTVLPGTGVTLTNAGAPHATQVALLVLFVAAVLLVGPGFLLLFSLQGRRVLQAEDPDVTLDADPAAGSGLGGPPGRPDGFGPGSRAAAVGLVAVAAIIRTLTGRRRER